MVFISSVFALFGRLCLALFFVLSGGGKVLYQSEYNEALVANPYLASLSAGPQWALPLGIFELIAGLLILFGLLTRLTAITFALYCLLTALFLHTSFGDPFQVQLFLQQVAMAGGFFVLFAYGNTRASLDTLRARRRDQVGVRDRAVHDGHDNVVRDGDNVVPSDHVTTTRRL